MITTPITFASLYWSEGGDMTHDWEKNGAIFISNNFNGSILSDFKDSMLLKYYGNFTKMYNNFFLVGQAPDVFNLTFVQEQKIQVIYLSQITEEIQIYQGRNFTIDSFAQNGGLNCIYSNGYSVALINPDS